MNENINELEPQRDVYSIIDYFGDHPIILLGVGISAVTIAICKILDDKYNNLGGK